MIKITQAIKMPAIKIENKRITCGKYSKKYGVVLHSLIKAEHEMMVK